MRLSKSIQIMSTVTVLALIYTHMQMQIFDLAYQGKKREKEIVRLKGQNSLVDYHIMQMTSSLHLGITVLSDDSGLQFSDQDNIVELVSPEPPEESGYTLAKERPVHQILSFFSLKAEAEARPLDKTSAFKPWRGQP